jgi:HEAT repeat protein
MTTNTFIRWAIVCGVLLATGCTDHADGWRTQLQDPDPSVRRQTIRSLAESPVLPADAISMLAAALEDREPSVRVAAALAIQHIDPQNRAFVPVLEAALREGQGPIFLVIGREGANASWAIPTLVSLLSDRRAPIRALAAQTLGEIGVASDRVETSLRHGLQDEKPAVQKACRQALDRLK